MQQFVKKNIHHFFVNFAKLNCIYIYMYMNDVSNILTIITDSQLMNN